MTDWWSEWQEWYDGFIRDCPSGQLTPSMFLAMYNQIFPCGDAEMFSQANLLPIINYGQFENLIQQKIFRLVQKSV